MFILGFKHKEQPTKCLKSYLKYFSTKKCLMTKFMFIKCAREANQ